MNVVIVGGGVGGVACAQRLARRRDQISVTLIDRSARHDFAPSFLWMLNGSRTAEQVSRPLANVTRWGTHFVNAPVAAIDAVRNTVTAGSAEIPYDELVLSPGAELAPDLIEGLAENASTFYTREAAQALAGRLLEFRGGRVVLVVPSMPYKCPAAPYEAAFLINAFLRTRGTRTSVSVHTIEPHPLPVAGAKIGARVIGLLERHGIGFHAQRTLTGVDAGGQSAVFEDGAEPFDLMVAIPPHRAPGFIRDSALAGPSGWLAVDQRTMSVTDHVHAIGDVTSISLPSGKPLPKAGVFAHAQANAVADRLIAAVEGREPTGEFDGHGACFLETGQGKAGVARGDFYALPNPRVRMFRPSRVGHLGKILFERRWLRQIS